MNKKSKNHKSPRSLYKVQTLPGVSVDIPARSRESYCSAQRGLAFERTGGNALNVEPSEQLSFLLLILFSYAVSSIA